MKQVWKVIPLFLLMLLLVGNFSPVFAGDPFPVTLFSFSPDSTLGNTTTPNSYAQVSYYRTQSTDSVNEVQVHDDIVDAVSPNTAYSIYDVGSGWDSPDINNTATEVMGVVETRNGLNGWSGPSYVAGVRKITTVNSGGMQFSRTTVEAIPTPTLSSKTLTSITIGWTGLADSNFGPNPGTLTIHNSVVSYNLYRSVNGGAYQAHGSPLAVVAQNRAAAISYTDNAISAGNTYKYKLTVNFDWPGKSGTKKYFETVSEGPESASMSLSPVLHHFDFSLTSPQSMDTAFTGTNTLTAKDVNGTTITDYNTSGSNVTVTENTAAGTVTGFTTPGNVILPVSFVNGVANLTGSMTYGGTFGSRQFKATAGSVSSLSNTISVGQGSFAKLGVNLNTPQTNATAFTTANLLAEDIYGNILANFDSIGEGINITVSGTGSTNVTSLAKTDFVAGVADLTSKNFTFTGQATSHIFTFTSQGTSVTVSKTVTINAGSITSVKIMDAAGAAANEVGAANVNIDTPVTYYAAGFDTSGNFVSNSTSGNWTSSGFDATDSYAQVSATGTSLVFAPRKVPSAGTISFDAGGKTDVTGTLTVVAGTAKTFSVTAPGSATAGTPFQITTVSAFDKYGNSAISYTGAKTLTITGAANGPESGAPTATITTTFTTGAANTFSALTLVKAETVQLTLTQGVVSGQSNAITVAATTPQRFHATAPATPTAGVVFNVTSMTAHDQFGNIASSYSGTNQISCGSLAGHDSSNGDAPICNQTPISFTNGVSTDPLSVTLFKRESFSIPVTDGSLNGTTNSVTVNAGAAATIVATSGDLQSAPVNTFLAAPLAVLVKDQYGNLKNNQTVQYVITLGGGSVSAASPATDTSGVATTNWKVGITAGSNNNTVEARVSGATGSPVIFTASATPAVATSIQVDVPATATAGSSFPVTLTAKDSLGNTDCTFTGAKTLSFSNPGNGPVTGTPTYEANTTFSGGVATVSVTLVKAESTTLHVVAGSLAGTSSSIVVSPATTSRFIIAAPSTVTVSVPFAITSIHSADTYGNTTTDYSGQKTLSYSGPGVSGTSSPSYTTTVDFSAGSATTVLVTTLVKIEQKAIAITEGSVSGSSNAVTVISPEAYYLEYVSGNNQTAVVGTAAALPLIVAVRDQYGALASGKTVAFAPSAGSISPTSVVTGADGLAQVGWTLGTTTGTQTVTASMTGITTTVAFNATATVGSPTKLEFTSVTQSIRVNTISAIITVCVQDQYGNSALTGSETAIDLSSTSTHNLFAKAVDGPWGITQTSISAGSGCTALYYQDSQAGSYNITATSNGLSSDTQAMTIIANDLVRLEVQPVDFTISQSNTQQMTAIVYNQNDEVEPNVTVVWTMADESAGAITQSGLYYPARVSKAYPNAIKATVGSLNAYASPTVTDPTGPFPSNYPSPTPSPVVTPTPVASPSPIIIIQQATSSGSVTNVTNTTNTTNTTVTNDNQKNYTIIVINNYYLGGQNSVSKTEQLSFSRSDYPVILSPKAGTIVEPNNVTISGTSAPDTAIVLSTDKNHVLGTAKSDARGNWQLIVQKEAIPSDQLTVTATVYGSSMNSSPVQFNFSQQDIFTQISNIINRL